MQIAERWFERKTVSDGVTLLWEPHVHPLLRCNIWHLRGRDSDLLIDTGVGVASLADAIDDLTDKPLIALATHIHYDHVGCLHEFDTRLMHPLEAPRMASYEQEFAELAADALPPGILAAFPDPAFDDALINAMPHAGYQLSDYRVVSTDITRTIDEGDVIELGDRALEVMHLPGHSPGSIGLLDAKRSTLYSGDALYDGALLDDLPDSSVSDYIETMKRLRKLDVGTVHGGHEASFGRTRMIELIDAYLHARA